jgi:uncharacterized membrane protein
MTQIRSEVQDSEGTISTHATGFAGKFILRSWLQGIARRIAAFCISHAWLQCLFVGGIALGFNLFQIGTPSLWFDEILSVHRAIQSLPVLLQIVGQTQPNMALYYLFLHFWLGFTGLLGLNPVEWVVRLPSAVFAALASMIVFLLGRRFIGMIAGFVAAGIYLLNDLQLVYAQQTRSYALQLLLICFAWYALFAILTGSSRQKRWWVCFTLAMVLAAYTQLFSYLILMAQIATFGILLFIPTTWRKTAWQQIRSLIISLGSMFILTFPMIYESRHNDKTGWLPVPHPKEIAELFITIADNNKIYLLLLFALCAVAVVVIAAVSSSRGIRLLQSMSFITTPEDERISRYQQQLPFVIGLLCWIAIPVVLSYLVSQGPIHLFSSRYLVTIVPPLVLLVGLGIAVVPSRIAQAILVPALLLVTIVFVPSYYQNAQIENWRTASLWLEQHYSANDGLVCFDNEQGCEVSLQYYFKAYPGAAHFTADSPGSFSWANYDITNDPGNVYEALNPTALSAFGMHHSRIFFILARIPDKASAAQAAVAQHWLDTHYHLLSIIVTSTVTIRLYLTNH